jgi:hypothetical protein
MYLDQTKYPNLCKMISWIWEEREPGLPYVDDDVYTHWEPRFQELENLSVSIGFADTNVWNDIVHGEHPLPEGGEPLDDFLMCVANGVPTPQ